MLTWFSKKADVSRKKQHRQRHEYMY